MELIKKEGKKLWISPRIVAWFMGIGMVLFCIHNSSLTLSSTDGATYFFLPWIGIAILLIGIMFLSSKEDFHWDFGKKKIYIPMLIILACTAISGFVNYSFMDALAGIIFMGALVLLYAISRVLGDDIFIAFIPAVIIEAISCVVIGNSGVRNGGIISITNYDISTGLLVFGSLVSAYKGRWWLVSIAIVGLFFTGAEEGLLGVAVTFVAVLCNRDWNRKLLLPIGTLILLLVICTPLGITQKLYAPFIEKIGLAQEAIVTQDINKDSQLLEEASGYRWVTHWNLEINNAKDLFIGHGYNIGEFYHGIQHHVILLIIYQIGIVAALAWLWITGYALFKFRGKSYVLIAVVMLSGFDHYFWTQVAPWWWAMIGVASTQVKQEYIFKDRR